MDASQPITAADGTPLKKKLAQAMFRSKLRATGLVVPLLAFVLASFVFPILALMWQGIHNDTFERLMPNLTEELRVWDGVSEPTEEMYALLVADLKQNRADKTIGKVASRVNQELAGTRSLFTSTARKAKKLEPPYKDALIKTKKKWGDIKVWQAMKLTNQSLTPGFYATSLDANYTVDQGFVMKEEKRQIYTKLFIRTLIISGSVMLLCLILGYPVAYLLATLPLKYSNLLMIMVLLPFWTSLLVRTTAWIAILQSQGVVNDLLVWIGITGDESRFSLIYNMTGTIIAMTHILLPFMILPLYSVMKTIAILYASGALARRDADNRLHQGLHAADGARDRRRRVARVHPCDRLLYHAGPCWRPGRPADLEHDRLSHAEIAELVAGRGAWRSAARRRAVPILGL